MPYTVWAAFNDFRSNTVDLDGDQVATARKSRDYLYEQIKQVAAAGYAPRLGGSYRNFGSFARGSKIRPLDDLDLLVLLDERGTKESSGSSDPYTSWLRIEDKDAPLADYPDGYGYVNSTKVLNAFRSGLARVPNYRKAEIHRNMQAVTLQLTSYSWNFDIVPAVPVVDWTGKTVYYLIPDGRSNWIRTDPRIDQKNVTSTNQQHSGKYLPTLRLLKYWNARTHKPRLQSYYFETLANVTFSALLEIADFPNGIKSFFEYASFYLERACPDPKNLGPNLDTGVTWETKSKVSEAMSESLQFAKYALMYEQQNDNKNAYYWWGRVFGSRFPAYG